MARDFLDDLPEKHTRQVVEKIEFLANNPHHPRSKQLEGFAPLRRMRVGDYRIVYFVESTVLKIPLIDTRNDDRIYRRLKRLFK